MTAVQKIDELIRIVDCALRHPVLPTAPAHKRVMGADAQPPRMPAGISELYPILCDLYKNVEASTAFREPVNAIALGIWDYHLRIERPVALRTVLDRITGAGADPARYSTAEEVLADLGLIWRNCEQFNGPMSALSEAARTCERWVADRLEQLADGKIAEPDAVDRFNDLFVEISGQDPQAADDLMRFVESTNAKLLTSDGDLDLEVLTTGDLKAMSAFLQSRGGTGAGKRPRE